MRESGPSLERLAPRRGRGIPPVLVAIAAIAAVAFLIGLAVGGRTVSTTTPNPPAITGAAVTSELRLAYLQVRGSGWALCSLAEPISCQPIVVVSSIELPDFGDLPLTVSVDDWGFLDAASVPVGHYALVGELPQVGASLGVASVATNGAGTLIETGAQAQADGVAYFDLGTLSAGRYVGALTAYQLQAGDPSQPIIATPLGWAVGFVVGPSDASSLSPTR
ncbi:MAG: hypothetical protein ACRDGI_04315 [Candidatus Limnocylindrales bacterium]